MAGEREYQRRRWGVRQPDGSFKELCHCDHEFTVFLLHYHQEALKAYSTVPGKQGALAMMRKLAGLCLAFGEMLNDLKGNAVTTVELIDNLKGKIRVHKYHTAQTLCLISATLSTITDDAIDNPPEADHDFVSSALGVILTSLLNCFMHSGVPARDLHAPIINVRDGLPA